jgi:O-antigen/teichoic acid export membrane protein
MAGTFSWLIDYVLPADYAQVKYIVVCSMAQPLLYTLSETTVVGLNVQRKSMHALGIAIFALMCNALLSFLLVPQFGAAGAAVSNALAYVVFFIARTEVSAKLWHPIPRKQLYSMIIVIVSIAIWTALQGHSTTVYPSFIWIAVFSLLIFIFRENLKFLRGFITKKSAS